MDEETLMQKIKEEKYSEAFTEIKEYLKEHPKDKQQLKLLAKLQNEYKKKGQKDILAKINSKVESKQFDDAINLINECLEILPDDKRVIQLKEKIESSSVKYELDSGYVAAKEQFDSENYSEAIKILTPLLKKYKTDQRLLKLKDDAETERWAQQSAKWTSEAQDFLQNEDFDNALKKIEMVLKRDSSNKNALKLREKILEEQKRTGKKKLWDEINTQIKIQNYSIALDRIKELLEIDPNDVKAQKLQSSIIETEMKFEKKKVMDRALAELNAYKFGDARRALDNISEHLKSDKDIMGLKDAINAAEQKYTLDNLIMTAKNLIKNKEYEKAEAKVDEAIKVSNNMSKDAITLKAELQKKVKKDKIDKMMDVLPIYQKGKKWEDALQIINQILELDSEQPKALKLKAQFEQELGIIVPKEKPTKVPAAPSAEAEEEGAPFPEEVQVVREYDYVGGEIRFKVAIRNNTETAVTNISVLLNVTEQYTIESLTKQVSFLAPGESRGVDFMLMPMACGQSRVFGTVSYSDAFGEPHSVTIQPKEIQIKCPLVIPESASREEIEDWLKSQLKSTCAVDLGNTQREQGFKVANEQIAALDLHNLFVDDVKLESEFLGIAKVTQNKILVRATALEDKVQIDVFTDDMKSATGILAYVRNLIQIAMHVQSDLQIKEDKIGVQILDAFDIIGRLSKICDLCQILGTINDGVLILNELTTQVEKSYLKDELYADLLKWKTDLEQQQDSSAQLAEELSNDLEYNAIDWIRTAHQITQSKYGVYRDTFDSSSSVATQKLEGRINAIGDEIIALENAYMRRIIRYLLIIHKDNGLVLFTHGFGKFQFDSDLVGGFLTAIQSFGVEISQKATPVTKLAYGAFELELKAGNFITVAIVLAGKGTELIRKKLNTFTGDFERKFKTNLEQWDGNIDAFKEIEPVVNKLFGIEESA